MIFSTSSAGVHFPIFGAGGASVRTHSRIGVRATAWSLSHGGSVSKLVSRLRARGAPSTAAINSRGAGPTDSEKRKARRDEDEDKDHKVGRNYFGTEHQRAIARWATAQAFRRIT
jgi:hypothetical protein